MFLLPWLRHWTERNLSTHTYWHHDVECSSDLQLRYRETSSRIGALVHTFCARLILVGDSIIAQHMYLAVRQTKMRWPQIVWMSTGRIGALVHTFCMLLIS